MNRKLMTFLAVLLIPVIIGLLLLVGLPRLSAINPMRLIQQVKRIIAERKIREPLQISKIVVNPKNPNIVYASSHFYGMLKSTDRGKTWQFKAKGLGTSDVYSMVMDPSNPDILYAATTGGGVYRSDDGAETWTPTSTGLTDTHIEDLVFDPADPHTIYAAALRRIFKSTDGGRSWSPEFDKNEDIAPLQFVHTLLVVRPSLSLKPLFFLATPLGGFSRAEGETEWEALEKKVEGQKLTAFAYDSRNQNLYAGSLGGGFYLSQDYGKSWKRMAFLPGQWIHRISIDPQNPSVIFAGSRGLGIFKSVDDGKTWTDVSKGLTHKLIKDLVFDPDDPKVMYAGAPSMLAISSDGGNSWTPVKITLPPYNEVVSWLSYSKISTDSTRPPPSEMREKCNQCHGWTDPILDYKPAAYWRVTPTHRDWTHTVNRMAGRANLTPEDKVVIMGYMNNYFGPK